MSEEGTSLMIPGPQENPASPVSTVATGKVSVTTDPTPLAIEILDFELKKVSTQMSPCEVELSPGLYIATAIRPGHPNISRVVLLTPGKKKSLHLTATEPSFFESLTETVFSFVGRNFLQQQPAPVLVGNVLTLDTSIKAIPVKIRFLRLKDWSTYEAVETVKSSSTYDQGQTVFDLTISERSIVFAQMAAEGKIPISVALPPAGKLRPARCSLVVTAGVDRLKARVRLATEWANLALQYMSEGYLSEALRVVKEVERAGEPAQGPSLLRRVLQDTFLRFEDPAAAVVLRYVRLRLGELELIENLPQFLFDLGDGMPDGLIISSELSARQKANQNPIRQFLQIPEGRTPLFTEGFSLLVSRFYQHKVSAEEALTDEESEKASGFSAFLRRWAPFVDLQCPTLTLSGADLTNPQGSQTPIDFKADENWIHGPDPV